MRTVGARQYRRYMLLIFVDVIEFDGTHITRFYRDMTLRYADLLARNDVEEIFIEAVGGKADA